MAVERMAVFPEDFLVRRVFSLTSALFADVLIFAYVLGVPTATRASLPWLIVPGVLLWFGNRRNCLLFGFGVFSIGAVHAAVSVWFIDEFTSGTALRAFAMWAFLAFIFGYACRLTILRRDEE